MAHIKVKTILLILVLAMICMSSSATCRSETDENEIHRVIFDCDGTDLLGNFMFNERPLSLSDVYAYVDTYCQTPITTFMICSGSHNNYYRSTYTRVLGEPLSDTGLYDDPQLERYYTNFLNVEREGADVITTVLERARKNHVETFITYRMNDLHYNALDQSPLSYSDFWKNHPEYCILRNGYIVYKLYDHCIASFIFCINCI